MKRLKDEVDSADPRLAGAAQLLADVAPLPESNAQKARVRRALEGKGSTRVRSRTAVAVAVLLGLSGSAAAAFGLAQVLEGPSHKDSPLQDSPLEDPPLQGDQRAPSSKAAQPSLSPDPHEKSAVPPLLEPSSAPERPLEASRGPDTGPSPAKKGAAPPPALRETTTTKEKTPVPTLSEARLVQEAVAALRTSGDTEKASALLSEYRKHSSSGHLDEEALALSIEVALVKKSPDAARYARTYLAKYPKGKFRPLAERALLSK